MKNKNSDPGINIRLKILVGLMIFIVVLSVFCYKAFVSTHYIVLPIQPPNTGNSKSHQNWASEEYIVESWFDSNNSYYNWRVKTDIIIDEGELTSRDSITSYFHDQLTEAGWITFKLIYSNPCHTVLPESYFLSYDSEDYEFFKRKNENNMARNFPIVCLAIWPEYYPDGRLWAYRVVLATHNPSLRMYLNNPFD
jgi:hypothetical protein